MEDPEYYEARSAAFAKLYFSIEERAKSVLDYGCGLGQTIAKLSDAAGFDASCEARDFARSKGIRVFDTPEEIPKNHFEIVICRHALEHVPDPLRTLEQIRTYLRPKGKLILILPQEKHFYSSFEPDNNMHMFCWNFRCINNLLSTAKYKVRSNAVYYNLGYRALLPIRRALGQSIYEGFTSIVGTIKRNGELVIHAERLD